MKNETFAETLQMILNNHRVDMELVFGNEKDLFKEILESVIYNFEIYGDFLNTIPLEDRENIISTKILTWIYNYASNDVNREINRLMPISKEASKEIKKNISIIEKFENMIHDNFSYLENTIDRNNKFNIPNKSQSINTMNSIKILLSTTKDLKHDLSSKNFNIFSKYKYYPLEITTKTNLSNILDELIDTYNIKGHNPHKKSLIDNIVTL
jgi:hypothetical protein